jgi:uncharacterized protein YaaW (UPF0174 family)
MPKNDTIFKRLALATEIEKGKIREAFQLHKNAEDNTISEVYRAAAGHTMISPFRDKHALPYKQILIDVADKLKPGLGWTDFKIDDRHTEENIEDQIEEYLRIIIDKKLMSLSEKERQEKKKKIEEELKRKGVDQATISSIGTAIASGSVGATLASSVAVSIFYSTFLSSISALLFGPSLITLLASGAGVTAVVAAPLLIVSLGNPAYRKTIPATLEFIWIRKRLEAEAKLGSKI